jgi:hypothetical protein
VAPLSVPEDVHSQAQRRHKISRARWRPQSDRLEGRKDDPVNRKNRIVAALTAALGAAAIGGGVAVAHAQPPPPPPPTTVVDTPEPGEAAEPTEAVDTDNIQDGDQNGPEAPDTSVVPAPPTP